MPKIETRLSKRQSPAPYTLLPEASGLGVLLALWLGSASALQHTRKDVLCEDL